MKRRNGKKVKDDFLFSAKINLKMMYRGESSPHGILCIPLLGKIIAICNVIPVAVYFDVLTHNDMLRFQHFPLVVLVVASLEEFA